MKVKDLIEQLKYYNQDADVFLNSNYKHIGFTLAFGGGDGVEKKNCETVSIYPDNLGCESSQTETEINEDTSDGYHTFKELYEFRKAYNVALFNQWGSIIVDFTLKYDVHKSWKHHDGELCFGGGWFIVVAVLPTGQISNHYPASDWDLFKIPEVEKAKYEFDGHTGQDVINRLLNI
jgi:hypothetical protein